MEETSGIVTVMEEVEIFTIPALFTPIRWTGSIYPGLHLYEIQARQDDGDAFPSYGADGYRLLRLHPDPIPVDRMENGQRDILPGDFILDVEAEHLTPANLKRNISPRIMTSKSAYVQNRCSAFFRAGGPAEYPALPIGF